MIQNNIIRTVFGKGRWLSLIVILLLLASMYSEKKAAVNFYTKSDVKKFQKTLVAKEKRISEILDVLQEECKKPEVEGLFSDLPDYFFNLYKEEGLAVFVYRDDSLCFWNDNSVTLPQMAENIPQSTIDHIGNSIFLKIERKAETPDSMRFIGLVLIKNEYPYENRFLKNGFQDDFSFSPAVRIKNSTPRFKNPIPGQGYPVYDISGQYLFSIDLANANRPQVSQKVLCLILYLLTFFIFLLFLRRFIRNAPKMYRKYLVVLLAPLLFFIYYLLVHFRIPPVVFELELFSPDIFARSALLDSLGDLFILTVTAFFVIYNFYMEFHFSATSVRKVSASSMLLYVFAGILALSIYLLNSFVFRSIVIDSSISFETYKVLALSVYTFIGLLILALQFAAFALVVDKVFSILKFRKTGVVPGSIWWC